MKDLLLVVKHVCTANAIRAVDRLVEVAGRPGTGLDGRARLPVGPRDGLSHARSTCTR